MDSKYLFYNKEMLQKAGIANPPKTWDELLADAKIIKQKGIVDYPIVWSWSQAEAVICDYAILLQAYGGKFLDENGKPAFNKGGGVDALKYMVQTLKEGVTNPHSTEDLEEDVRGVFSSGKAAFALNWTYMYGMANTNPKESQIVGKVGVIAPRASQARARSAPSTAPWVSASRAARTRTRPGITSSSWPRRRSRRSMPRAARRSGRLSMRKRPSRPAPTPI